MRTRTKIVCTLGPATRDRESVMRLISAGMNVARLNFSHTSHEDGQRLVNLLHGIRDELGLPLAVLLDTKGPEVRLYGHDEPVPLAKGEVITIESCTGDLAACRAAGPDHFLTNLPRINELVEPGQRLLLMDGFIGAEVVEIDPAAPRVRAVLKNDGRLRPKAHLTVPGLDYPLPFLSTQDEADIAFAVKHRIEFIALSFVRHAADVQQVRNLMLDLDPDTSVRLIAKIELQQALRHLDEIIAQSDGIMVARGDLGVEVDIEEVPLIQKRLISDCYRAGKPVITATQMLESMVENPVPTRAEASDVANACYDLTSAVMLSGETAVGRYPEQVVQTMARILARAESAIDYEGLLFTRREPTQVTDLTNAVTRNALATAYQSGARAVAVVTKSGYSARMLSRLRPGLPLYAFTDDPAVYHQLALSWGILPCLIPHQDSFERLLETVMRRCESDELARPGDLLVFVAGLPLGVRGATNMIRVESVGKARLEGRRLGPGGACGPVVFIQAAEDFLRKDVFRKIVFLRKYHRSFLPHLKGVRAVVMESEDHAHELGLAAEAFRIPVLVGVRGVFERIQEESTVEIPPDGDILVER